MHKPNKTNSRISQIRLFRKVSVVKQQKGLRFKPAKSARKFVTVEVTKRRMIIVSAINVYPRFGS